jgi:hypothetical protein
MGKIVLGIVGLDFSNDEHFTITSADEEVLLVLPEESRSSNALSVTSKTKGILRASIGEPICSCILPHGYVMGWC